MVKFSSPDWIKLTGVIVMDPDGWDRRGDFNTDWNREIDFDTFYDKASNSTTNLHLDRETIRKQLGL